MNIVEENAQLTDVFGRLYWWDAGFDINGFVRSSYYTPGQTAQFSVDYNAAFTGDVWRLGWYGGGEGNARKVATITGTPTDQPEAVVIPNSNNAVTCAAWSVNAEWPVPADATPGMYHVLWRSDTNADFGKLVFCVTDTLDKKPIAVLSSDATWGAAYNYYGGKTATLTGASVYGSNGPMLGGIENRSLCVSYDRPVVTGVGIGQTYFMNAEYPLMRFLERFGFEAGHVTCEQVDADPSVLDDREIVIFAGHNEYTSQRIWDKFMDLHMYSTTRTINLSGNDFFWRTRYGTTDHLDTATRGRVMWCRKDTMPGPAGHVPGRPIVDGDWGGTWQDTRWTQRVAWSEQLWGDLFIANGVRHDQLQVPYAMKTSPFWRDCPAVQALTEGQTHTFGLGSLGMEWDVPAGNVPKAFVTSSTYDLTANGASDINGQNYAEPGVFEHKAFLMRTPKGAIFNGSNCQHSWVLEAFHAGMHNDNVVSADGMQSMLNLLADFGAPEPYGPAVAAAGLTVPTPVALSEYGLEDLTSADLADLEGWLTAWAAWVPLDVVGMSVVPT